MPSAVSYVVSIDQSMQGSSTVFFALLFYWYFSSWHLLSLAYIQNISQNNSFGCLTTFTRGGTGRKFWRRLGMALEEKTDTGSTPGRHRVGFTWWRGTTKDVGPVQNWDQFSPVPNHKHWTTSFLTVRIEITWRCWYTNQDSRRIVSVKETCWAKKWTKSLPNMINIMLILWVSILG